MQEKQGLYSQLIPKPRTTRRQSRRRSPLPLLFRPDRVEPSRNNRPPAASGKCFSPPQWHNKTPASKQAAGLNANPPTDSRLAMTGGNAPRIPGKGFRPRGHPGYPRSCTHPGNPPNYPQVILSTQWMNRLDTGGVSHLRLHFKRFFVFIRNLLLSLKRLSAISPHEAYSYSSQLAMHSELAISRHRLISRQVIANPSKTFASLPHHSGSSCSILTAPV